VFIGFQAWPAIQILDWVGSVRKRLGTRIRELRHAHRLSQEQLGERAGISYKFLGEVERGAGNPTVDWLEVVSTALGVAISSLFDDDPQTIRFAPLPGKAFSIVRDAHHSLETVLREFAKPVEYRPTRRRPSKRSSGSSADK
jgi:transcriptional regulator with XRE-family HTH domain